MVKQELRALSTIYVIWNNINIPDIYCEKKCHKSNVDFFILSIFSTAIICTDWQTQQQEEQEEEQQRHQQ